MYLESKLINKNSKNIRSIRLCMEEKHIDFIYLEENSSFSHLITRTFYRQYKSKY